MESIQKNIMDELSDLLPLFHRLFFKYSSLRYSEYFYCTFPTQGRDYIWVKLSNEGMKVQSEIYIRLTKLFEIIRVVISEQPNNLIKLFEQQKYNIMHVLEQDRTYISSIENAYDSTVKSFEQINDILLSTYSTSIENCILVPDTNALIMNPNLDLWRFKFYPFEIVLSPTVLSELDKLKITHRSPEVRDKASGVIKRIKGYRNRGKLTEGVVLSKGISTLRSLAKEPSFENNFSWLDPSNNDDRIIATLIEVIKQYPRSMVALVTDDLNLQNKCEFARLSFVEVPEFLSN